eukprot:TRINITY_DN36186_c0_g1_i9.p2 TRINITY_DN36186_c0_g1~~TRINITY_DN36186_c0_g1_i9.p2  ORF type:complete len:307 (+),score=-26.63 TRINITY_DN36186_c0_g1_i9:252-1172(+)
MVSTFRKTMCQKNCIVQQMQFHKIQSQTRIPRGLKQTKKHPPSPPLNIIIIRIIYIMQNRQQVIINTNRGKMIKYTESFVLNYTHQQQTQQNKTTQNRSERNSSQLVSMQTSQVLQYASLTSFGKNATIMHYVGTYDEFHNTTQHRENFSTAKAAKSGIQSCQWIFIYHKQLSLVRLQICEATISCVNLSRTVAINFQKVWFDIIMQYVNNYRCCVQYIVLQTSYTTNKQYILDMLENNTNISSIILQLLIQFAKQQSSNTLAITHQNSLVSINYQKQSICLQSIYYQQQYESIQLSQIHTVFVKF